MNGDVAAEMADWIAQTVGRQGVSDWITVDQPMICAFADATHDWNFLHVDERAARGAGLDGTIAHGFLTLSLLAPMRMDTRPRGCPGMKMAVNYGLEGVRFLAPVPAGSRIRGHFRTIEIVETQAGRYREKIEVSVEIEGQDRPALVATWLTLYMT